MNYRSLYLLNLILFVCLGLVSGSCKVGEDDPFVSFRSRDNRLKGSWKMSQLENHLELRTFEPGAAPSVTVIDSKFDGLNMNVKTYANGALVSDSTFGFGYQLRLEENGHLTYDYTVIYFGLAGLKSDGQDTWYWLNNDKKKARVYLGNALQFPTTAGILGQLPAPLTFFLGSFISDFEVEGLRKDELKLTFDKASNQTTGTGGVQQIILNSNMTFDSK